MERETAPQKEHLHYDGMSNWGEFLLQFKKFMEENLDLSVSHWVHYFSASLGGAAAVYFQELDRKYGSIWLEENFGVVLKLMAHRFSKDVIHQTTYQQFQDSKQYVPELKREARVLPQPGCVDGEGGCHLVKHSKSGTENCMISEEDSGIDKCDSPILGYHQSLTGDGKGFEEVGAEVSDDPDTLSPKVNLESETEPRVGKIVWSDAVGCTAASAVEPTVFKPGCYPKGRGPM